MKYRKKPVIVEAVQWDGKNVPWSFFGAPHDDAINIASQSDVLSSHLLIKTLEGIMTATAGDWIIKGVKGEFYPCKPDIFAATYEPADQEATPPTPPAAGGEG